MIEVCRGGGACRETPTPHACGTHGCHTSQGRVSPMLRYQWKWQYREIVSTCMSDLPLHTSRDVTVKLTDNIMQRNADIMEPLNICNTLSRHIDILGYKYEPHVQVEHSQLSILSPAELPNSHATHITLFRNQIWYMTTSINSRKLVTDAGVATIHSLSLASESSSGSSSSSGRRMGISSSSSSMVTGD